MVRSICTMAMNNTDVSSSSAKAIPTTYDPCRYQGATTNYTNLAVRNSYHLLHCRYSSHVRHHNVLCATTTTEIEPPAMKLISSTMTTTTKTIQYKICMSSSLRWQIICKHNFVKCARVHTTSSTYANREQTLARVACNICHCEKSHIRQTINHGGNFTLKIESFRRFAFCDNSTLMVAQCSPLICM